MARKTSQKTSVEMDDPRDDVILQAWLDENVSDTDDRLNLEVPVEQHEHDTDLQLSKKDNDDTV